MLPTATRFGDLRLVSGRCYGAGGEGVVYLATQESIVQI
jgi:hypothetical protein